MGKFAWILRVLKKMEDDWILRKGKRSLSWFLVACYATLWPAMSVRRSALAFFVLLLLLPNCLKSLFYHCPCPPARNFGSRVYGLVPFLAQMSASLVNRIGLLWWWSFSQWDQTADSLIQIFLILFIGKDCQTFGLGRPHIHGKKISGTVERMISFTSKYTVYWIRDSGNLLS